MFSDVTFKARRGETRAPVYLLRRKKINEQKKHSCSALAVSAQGLEVCLRRRRRRCCSRTCSRLIDDYLMNMEMELLLASASICICIKRSKKKLIKKSNNRLWTLAVSFAGCFSVFPHNWGHFLQNTKTFGRLNPARCLFLGGVGVCFFPSLPKTETKHGFARIDWRNVFEGADK